MLAACSSSKWVRLGMTKQLEPEDLTDCVNHLAFEGVLSMDSIVSWNDKTCLIENHDTPIKSLLFLNHMCGCGYSAVWKNRIETPLKA
jgi:hypothetical protein